MRRVLSSCLAPLVLCAGLATPLAADVDWFAGLRISTGDRSYLSVSAAHFGLIGVKDGFLFAQPRSIMNAIYGGLLRELHGRDKGSNCSNWAQWPNR